MFKDISVSMKFTLKPKLCSISVQKLSVCIPLSVYILFILIRNFTSIPLRSSERKSLEQFLKNAVIQNKDKSVMLSVNVMEKDSLKRNFNSEERRNIPPTELLASIFLK